MSLKHLQAILVSLFLLFIGEYLNAQQVTPPVKGVGVVIKKNPGSGASMITGITNLKGETEIVIPEKGNYVVAVLNPCRNGYEWKNGHCVPVGDRVPKPQAMTEQNGGPIKGVRIGLGKNPPGPGVAPKMIAANNNGEAEFTNLEPGRYTLKVEAANYECPIGFHNENGTCVVNENNPQAKEKPDSTSKNPRRKYPYGRLILTSKIFIGGGITSPSTSSKSAGVVNGIDLNVGYFKPLWTWNNEKVSLGLNGELGYTLGNGAYDFKNEYTVYQLAGQVQPPKVVENSSSIKNSSFRVGAGLQMNVHISNNFIVAPIFNAVYLSTIQKLFSVDETIYPQGSSATYRLLEQKETKTTGVGLLPKLRFIYNITPRLGIWMEGNYTMGPTIKSASTRFEIDPTIPANNINEGNFQEGQYITTSKETRYSVVGVNGGVVMKLNKVRMTNRSDKKTVEDIQVVTVVTKEDDPKKVKCNCGEELYGKDADQCCRLCQYLKDGTYIDGCVTAYKRPRTNIKTQLLDLPNGMGIGFMPVEKLVVKKSSQKDIVYTELTEAEMKNISRTSIQFLMPASTTISTANLDNIGGSTNQYPDYYWKLYKTPSGKVVGVPQILLLNDAGYNGLSISMRKKKESEKPCQKFQFRNLPIDLGPPAELVPDEDLILCIPEKFKNLNLISLDNEDPSDTEWPEQVVMHNEGTNLFVGCKKVTQPVTTDAIDFTTQYIQGFGAVAYPLDFQISKEEATVLLNRLFLGSKPKNVVEVRSDGGRKHEYIGHITLLR